MTFGLVKNQPLSLSNSSPFKFSEVQSLEAISEEEYSPLSAGRTFYVSRPWLLATEKLRKKGTTSYIVARNKNDQLVGILPLYWGKPSKRGFYAPFGRFLSRSEGSFNEDDWSPTFIIGSRTAYACEFLISSTIDESEKTLILKNLLELAEKKAYIHSSASISAFYINERGRNQLKELINPQNDFFISGANTILDIKWDNFDDYLASMNTKIRRENRVFNSEGYQIIESDLKSSIDVLAELFAKHEQKYGHETSAANEAEELHTLAKYANDKSVVLLIKSEDSIVGGILLFVWEDTVYGRNLGISTKGEKFEYFNLSFYEPIRFAIENGYKHIDLGMTSYPAKVRRGARIEPLWGLVASQSKPSPFKDIKFSEWNKRRLEAINLNDAKLVEGRQIP